MQELLVVRFRWIFHGLRISLAWSSGDYGLYLGSGINHRDVGFEEGGADNIWYKPLRFAISTFTEGVIRFGMR